MRLSRPAQRLTPDDGATYGNRGRAWARKHELDRALSDLSQAVQLNPNNPVDWQGRGWVLAQLSRKEEAIADYRHALSLDPKDEFSANALKELGASP